MTIWDKIKASFAGKETVDNGAARAREFFEMRVEDVFKISGRGVVVTGKIAVGVVRIGDRAILRSGSADKPCRVTRIENLRTLRDAATAGENVGVMLDGVQREDIKAGDTLRSAEV
jgi:translation elongation factor EF-Tu-like GTPase